jgi:hypothetical protein
MQQTRTILGEEARSMSPQDKWDLLAPFLLRHGREALSYATLQQGMEYFICPLGYIAFTSVTHPVFARKTRRMVLSDPLCAPEDLRELVRQFLDFAPGCAFVVVSEKCASVLRELGFRANCLGYEPELPIQTYNTKGNWKELDLIKRARNEAKREGIVIREASIENINREELDDLTRRWIGTKKVNDHEIWVYARRPVLGRSRACGNLWPSSRTGTSPAMFFTIRCTATEKSSATPPTSRVATRNGLAGWPPPST